MDILRRRKDLLIGIGMLAVSVFYYISSMNIQTRSLLAAYGPDIMPRIYGGILAILSILLIISDLIKLKLEKKTDKVFNNEGVDVKKAVIRTVGTISLVGIYMLILKPVGFLVSSALFIMLQLIVISPQGKVNYLKYGVTAVVTAVLLDYLFVSLFNLGLPHGILGF